MRYFYLVSLVFLLVFVQELLEIQQWNNHKITDYYNCALDDVMREMTGKGKLYSMGFCREGWKDIYSGYNTIRPMKISNKYLQKKWIEYGKIWNKDNYEYCLEKSWLPKKCDEFLIYDD